MSVDAIVVRRQMRIYYIESPLDGPLRERSECRAPTQYYELHPRAGVIALISCCNQRRTAQIPCTVLSHLPLGGTIELS